MGTPIETVGHVHHLTVAHAQACVQIGPTLSSVEQMFVQEETEPSTGRFKPFEGPFKSSLIDLLMTALVHRHIVKALHDDANGKIIALRIDAD